jgi:hypothetical protein
VPAGRSLPGPPSLRLPVPHGAAEPLPMAFYPWLLKQVGIVTMSTQCWPLGQQNGGKVSPKKWQGLGC